MKLNFDWKDDGKPHRYCAHCYAETVQDIHEDGKLYFYCSTCGQKHERSIFTDPVIHWWVADDGEIWHESAGVFIRNPEGKFLLFERTIFPFSFTVPAGHVDTGEDPLAAAHRETEEEVGLRAGTLVHIAGEDIEGDSCSRGSDAHRWNAYLLPLETHTDVEVKEEGKHPVWLTIDEALQKDLVYPVRYYFEKFGEELTAKV